MFAKAEPKDYSVASSLNAEQKFISFQLGVSDTALLPLEGVAELFQVSLTEILPVPEVPSCVLGIYNWREEMLWLVDLNALSGLTPLIQSASLLLAPMTMVVQAGGQFMGLVVSQVKDIEMRSLQQMNNPDAGVFTPEILPLLKGYFIGANNEVIRIFEPSAIIQAPLWHQPSRKQV
jgi:positive phototaxis protein PixI